MSKRAGFKFTPFSMKQKKVLTWWLPESPVRHYDGIIADGSVRAGKTIIMSLSFVIWAMESFQFETFGMAGKTIASFRRNVLFKLKIILLLRGYKLQDRRSDNLLVVSKGDVENYFYIFGGKDEASQDLVQGLTCAGFFFDEVVLMPESFVNQAVARCSVEGSKLWFNCNPDSPYHFMKTEWLDKRQEKSMLHVHFELDDNPSLSMGVKDRYKRMFSGVFYERFILGRWVMAEGIIYSMFSRDMIIDRVPLEVTIQRKWIGIDYGQSNATVFILLGLGSDGVLYILDEYYHEGRNEHIQKSPSGYAKDFMAWKIKNGVDGIPVKRECVYIDPSAKGFMLQLHEEGERQVRQADNTVLKGIELFSSLIDNDKVRVLRQCKHTIIEFNMYSWDSRAQQRGEDVPIKQYDHCLDALRYIINGNRLLFQRLITDKTPIKNRLPLA
jgi:PBSX family phage terminase large subunit